MQVRRRRRVCGGCGQTGRLEIHHRRVKRWRHLDLGASRCINECELRRLRCPDCGVRLEALPWARAGAAHTRDFEDLVAWLAQQMAFAPIARLLRIGWHTIGPIARTSSPITSMSAGSRAWSGSASTRSPITAITAI
jgi:transposase